jgi:hypothetical protein
MDKFLMILGSIIVLIFGSMGLGLLVAYLFK